VYDRVGYNKCGNLPYADRHHGGAVPQRVSGYDKGVTTSPKRQVGSAAPTGVWRQRPNRNKARARSKQPDAHSLTDSLIKIPRPN